MGDEAEALYWQGLDNEDLHGGEDRVWPNKNYVRNRSEWRRPQGVQETHCKYCLTGLVTWINVGDGERKSWRLMEKGKFPYKPHACTHRQTAPHKTCNRCCKEDLHWRFSKETGWVLFTINDKPHKCIKNPLNS